MNDYTQRILSQAMDGDSVELGKGRESANYPLAARIMANLRYNGFVITRIPDPIATVCEICDKETNGTSRHASCDRDGWYADETRDQYV